MSDKKDFRYLRKMTPRSVHNGEHGEYGMAWLACRGCGGKFTANLPSGKIGCVNCGTAWIRDKTDKYYDDSWKKDARQLSQTERDYIKKWAEEEMKKEIPSYPGSKQVAIELTKPRG